MIKFAEGIYFSSIGFGPILVMIHFNILCLAELLYLLLFAHYVLTSKKAINKIFMYVPFFRYSIFCSPSLEITALKWILDHYTFICV